MEAQEEIFQDIGPSQDEITRIMNDLEQEERLENEHNQRILKSIRRLKDDDFRCLIYDCSSIGKMEIVDGPEGMNQNESIGPFKKVYVDQWSVGDSGDSYSGFIYAKLSANRWLKIPYSC